MTGAFSFWADASNRAALADKSALQPKYLFTTAR
jgi:hypothetical protein